MNARRATPPNNKREYKLLARRHTTPSKTFHFSFPNPPFPRQQREKLVILGSGWGAASLLKGIDAAKFDVTVVSPRNHFLVSPLRMIRSILIPIQRPIFPGKKNPHPTVPTILLLPHTTTSHTHNYHPSPPLPTTPHHTPPHHVTQHR